MSRPSTKETSTSTTQPWLLEHLKQHNAPYPSLALNPQLQEIRLLHLHSGRGRLRGSLRVFSLELSYHGGRHPREAYSYSEAVDMARQQCSGVAALQFEALSYTWGESLHREHIQVQGGINIPITDNLARALRRLRHRKEPRDLWIDAICINQKNLRERSQQVAYMGEIYRRARRVIVWLGDLPHDLSLLSRTLFAILLRLPEFARPRQAEIQQRHQRLPKFERLRDLHQDIGQRNRRRFQQALEATLRDAHPRWHERVWTVQEFLLAQEIVYYHGPFRWDDHDSFLCQYRVGLEFHEAPHLKRFFNSDYPLTALRRESVLDLHVAPSIISVRECADPRDRVYGLLDCMSGLANLTPDYTLPVEQVFTDATHAILLKSGRMDILAFAMVSDVPRTLLPTWAIDFANLDPLLSMPSVQSTVGCGDFWRVHYADCFENPNLTRFTRRGSNLEVTGSRFDVVEDMVQVPVSRENWEPTQSSHLAIEMLERLVRRVHATSRRPLTAYGKSVWGHTPLGGITDTSIDLKPLPGEWGDYWRRPKDPFGFLEKVALEGNRLCQLTTLPQFTTSHPMESTISGYMQYLETISEYASVVVTMAGIPALAPGIVQRGDMIAILPFALAPVMLRPDARSGTFAFRGFVLPASYGSDDSLDGFWRRNGIDDEKFVLR